MCFNVFNDYQYIRINRIVQSFPSNKAPWKDKLHMTVVKDALPAILPILTEIINSSLLTSGFPSPWKESEIVSILKDGGDAAGVGHTSDASEAVR